jgi:hypothetical protein
VLARELDLLLAAQLTAGGAWGCIMMASFSAALGFGRTGREGLAVGLLFAALAGATLVRIAAVLAELPRHSGLAPALEWAPFALWFAAGLLFATLALGGPRRRASS